ncbi:hypothetical protein A3B32_00145 [Candidatus Uhrbacteria bacterium RIFCSPLOWO2_01_FULL_53_9]|uniref:O-antigen ligase domain-containing protein n=1 Tax=Candidatus Uhrbacteria bacterium RIFCSPLOWO2_01_FULL_53_9 TaxID=1802403 RepID=A0A1F7UWI7_9BACT|nr:MAG: hypothetical protein A3B32_00145 [Candidatus Uhrbacteria bacterium RIFCSPLOWO2_01_FULL_53_9]
MISRATFVRAIKEAFAERELWLLNASVLLYVALLPFHLAISVPVPVLGQMRGTEVAALLVTLFAVMAYLRGHVRLQKAFWLYVFLALNVGAQALSVLFAPNGLDSFAPAIAMAQYSVLLFVLIHAFHSESLLKAILVVMGLSVLMVVGHALALFVIQGGVFHTREQPTIIGTEIGNYLGYLLAMFGVGVCYVFCTERTMTWRIISGVVLAGWLYSVIISGVKMSQIAVLALLLMLVLIAKCVRVRAGFALLVYAILFGIQFHIVPIQNQYVLARRAVEARVTMVESAWREASREIGRWSQERVRTVALSYRVKEKRTQRSTMEEPVGTPEGPGDAVAKPAPDAMMPPTSLASPVEKTAREKTSPASVVGQPPRAQETVMEQEPIAEPEPEPKVLSVRNTENFVQNRWVDESASSLELRSRGMFAAFYMGLSHPLTGVGPGQQLYFFDHFSEVVRERNYQTRSVMLIPRSLRKYVFSKAKWTISTSNPNNFLLMLWAETGLLGLVAFLGLFFVMGFEALRGWWLIRHKRGPCSLRFILASCVGLILFQLVNPFMLHPWFWTTLALLYASGRAVQTGSWKPRETI